MKVEMISIDKVKEADYNPRNLDNHAKQGLIQSIKEFGLQQPLIINETTGNLVSGHQRLTVCKELGIEKVPVIYVNLTETKEKAFNITLNNKHIEGVFNEHLNELLNEIQQELGDEFIFNLNLDEVLKDIEITPIEDESDNEPEEPEEDKDPIDKLQVFAPFGTKQQVIDVLKKLPFEVKFK